MVCETSSQEEVLMKKKKQKWQQINHSLSFSRISSSVILDFFLCLSVFLYKVLELAFSAEGGVTSLFGAAGEAMDSTTERV